MAEPKAPNNSFEQKQADLAKKLAESFELIEDLKSQIEDAEDSEKEGLGKKLEKAEKEFEKIEKEDRKLSPLKWHTIDNIGSTAKNHVHEKGWLKAPESNYKNVEFLTFGDIDRDGIVGYTKQGLTLWMDPDNSAIPDTEEIKTSDPRLKVIVHARNGSIIAENLSFVEAQKIISDESEKIIKSYEEELNPKNTAPKNTVTNPTVVKDPGNKTSEPITKETAEEKAKRLAEKLKKNQEIKVHTGLYFKEGGDTGYSVVEVRGGKITFVKVSTRKGSEGVQLGGAKTMGQQEFLVQLVEEGYEMTPVNTKAETKNQKNEKVVSQEDAKVIKKLWNDEYLPLLKKPTLAIKERLQLQENIRELEENQASPEWLKKNLPLYESVRGKIMLTEKMFIELLQREADNLKNYFNKIVTEEGKFYKKTIVNGEVKLEEITERQYQSLLTKREVILGELSLMNAMTVKGSPKEGANLDSYWEALNRITKGLDSKDTQFEEIVETIKQERENSKKKIEKSIPDVKGAKKIQKDFAKEISSKEESGVATRAKQIQYLKELGETIDSKWLYENLPNYKRLRELIEVTDYINKWNADIKTQEKRRAEISEDAGKFFETIKGADGKKTIREIPKEEVLKLEADIDFMKTRIEAHTVQSAYKTAKEKFDAIPDDKRYELRGTEKIETTLFIAEKKKYIAALEALVASQEARGIKNTPEASELRNFQVEGAKKELEKIERAITPLEKQDLESKSYVAEKVFTLEALGNNPEIRNSLSAEAIRLLQSLPLLKNEGLLLQDPPKRPFLERSGSNTGSFTATLTFERETGSDFFERKGKQITVQFFITLTKDGFAISPKKDGSGQEPHIISTHTGEALELRKQLAAISGGISETSEIAKFLNEEIEHETGKKIGNAWVEGTGKDAKINISTGPKVANFDPTKKTEPLTKDQKEKLEELNAQKEQLLSDYPKLTPTIVAAPTAPTAPTTTLETPEERQAREEMEWLMQDPAFRSFLLKIEDADRIQLEDPALIAVPKNWLDVVGIIVEKVKDTLRESVRHILSGGNQRSIDTALQDKFRDEYAQVMSEERAKGVAPKSKEQIDIEKIANPKIQEKILRRVKDKIDSLLEENAISPLSYSDIGFGVSSDGKEFQVTINKKLKFAEGAFFTSDIAFSGIFTIENDTVIPVEDFKIEKNGGRMMRNDLKKIYASFADDFTKIINE